MNQSASLSPELKGSFKREVIYRKSPLNESQKSALHHAISHRLTLIQGPPGTGKTTTAVNILATLSQQTSQPILATAESNVAVDNLLEGLLDLGVKALRIGRPVKVREHLREATLDARLEQHPAQDELRFLEETQRKNRQKLPALKGKDKGEMHREIQRTGKEMLAIEKRMTESLLDEAEVICATTVGAGHQLLEHRRFPIVLMDEATQATEPSALIPIVKGCRQLILVGDQAQLPPTVISQRAEEGGLNQSLFERLLACGLSSQMLTTQYRMHPILREFPSARFYDNRLEDGMNDVERPTPAGFLWPNWEKPMAFVPVEGVEIEDEEGKSKSNLDEAAKVLEIVTQFCQTGELMPDDIGVITPYAGQVQTLNDLFEQGGGVHEGQSFEGLEVKSVDGYQGREKEVIIFSCVRANNEGKVGFLSDFRRLNVAITRAKRGLILLGNVTTLRHDPTWAAYLDWVEEQGLFAWYMTYTS